MTRPQLYSHFFACMYQFLQLMKETIEMQKNRVLVSRLNHLYVDFIRQHYLSEMLFSF